MIGRRLEFIFAGALVAITACASSSGDSDDRPIAIPGVEQGDGAEGAAPTTTTTTTVPTPPTTTTTTTPTTSTTTSPTSTTTSPTTSPTSTTPATSTTSTTTTTTVPELDVFDPLCVVRIQSGDSLGVIAARFDDPTVTASSLQSENGIDDADAINAGSLLDVCVDNGLDDITGAERVEPSESIESAARRVVVEAQQTKLNELFAGHGIRELLVDGVSGPVTRQRLCAARVSLGIPVSRDHMEAGSLEEVALLTSDALPPPASSALQSDRWALVDRTCQIMFVGAGPDSLAFVFSTSTGEAGHETRDQDRSEAFRYDPALENGGWHNSTTFPVAIDNPLNGNMYRPIYFDGGQAIHGSNNVPTTPQSKGCMRLRVADQDALVAWLGLDGLGAPTWSENRIDLRVNVQGAYVPS